MQTSFSAVGWQGNQARREETDEKCFGCLSTGEVGRQLADRSRPGASGALNDGKIEAIQVGVGNLGRKGPPVNADVEEDLLTGIVVDVKAVPATGRAKQVPRRHGASAP